MRYSFDLDSVNYLQPNFDNILTITELHHVKNIAEEIWQFYFVSFVLQNVLFLRVFFVFVGGECLPSTNVKSDNPSPEAGVLFMSVNFNKMFINMQLLCLLNH